MNFTLKVGRLLGGRPLDRGPQLGPLTTTAARMITYQAHNAALAYRMLLAKSASSLEPSGCVASVSFAERLGVGPGEARLGSKNPRVGVQPQLIFAKRAVSLTYKVSHCQLHNFWQRTTQHGAEPPLPEAVDSVKPVSSPTRVFRPLVLLGDETDLALVVPLAFRHKNASFQLEFL